MRSSLLAALIVVTALPSAGAGEVPRPRPAVPTVAEIEAVGPVDPAKALAVYCDWLIEHRTPEGFLSRRTRSWYRAAYPLRTLLACHDLFGGEQYHAAATTLLDKLVGEQLPNGAWAATFADRPVAARSSEEIELAMSGTTNTADVGTVTTALAVAHSYVDAERQRAYREALERFTAYALRFRLDSGAFTNGRWKGRDMTVPYSVATATQATSFCALHAITGDEAHLAVAEKAVRFLLDRWRKDGRSMHHHHERPTTNVLPATAFGDLFYSDEAFLWVWHWTKDAELERRIRRVLGWQVLGSKGLLAARENEVWWPIEEPWTNSKAAAMPLVLIEYERSMGSSALLREAVRRCETLLATPELAARIGVMADPETPGGEQSLTATGFAGLALAERIEPGVIYLERRDPQPR